MPDGLGAEMMELCLPLIVTTGATGYLVATYSLQGMLSEMIGPA